MKPLTPIFRSESLPSQEGSGLKHKTGNVTPTNTGLPSQEGRGLKQNCFVTVSCVSMSSLARGKWIEAT